MVKINSLYYTSQVWFTNAALYRSVFKLDLNRSGVSIRHIQSGRSFHR